MYHVRLENSPAGYIYWEDPEDAPFLKAIRDVLERRAPASPRTQC